MAYELVIGLLVTDESGYEQYRKAMRPILEEYSGGFRYDFRVSEVLKTQAEHEINRVFMIFFKDEHARESFFANEEYKEVRKRYFDPSVSGTTVLAAYETADG